MPGQSPVSGALTEQTLASTLSGNEQLMLEQLTGLSFDPNKVGNLATFISQPNITLGLLAIVDKGATSPGTKIIAAATVYIQGAKKDVDVYRLPS